MSELDRASSKDKKRRRERNSPSGHSSSSPRSSKRAHRSRSGTKSTSPMSDVHHTGSSRDSDRRSSHRTTSSKSPEERSSNRNGGSRTSSGRPESEVSEAATASSSSNMYTTDSQRRETDGGSGDQDSSDYHHRERSRDRDRDDRDDRERDEEDRDRKSSSGHRSSHDESSPRQSSHYRDDSSQGRRLYPSSHHNEMTSNALYIGNLQWWTTDQQLEDLFKEFGDLKTLKIYADKANGKSKGYAFIEYSDIFEAERAKRKIDGISINGKHCVISFVSASSHKARSMEREQREQEGYYPSPSSSSLGPKFPSAARGVYGPSSRLPPLPLVDPLAGLPLDPMLPLSAPAINPAFFPPPKYGGGGYDKFPKYEKPFPSDRGGHHRSRRGAHSSGSDDRRSSHYYDQKDYRRWR